jgi:hypothetical protein
MPRLLGILETALYVDEFERACAFYEHVLGLNSIYRDARLCAYDVGGRGVLLLFCAGRRSKPCTCRAAASRRTMVTGRSIWLSRLPPTKSPPGKRGSRTPMLKSKAAPNGRAAAKASTSAIPTDTCSNSRHRACGRVIRQVLTSRLNLQRLTPSRFVSHDWTSR